MMYKPKADMAIELGLLVMTKQKWQNRSGPGRARTYLLTVPCDLGGEAKYTHDMAVEEVVAFTGTEVVPAPRALQSPPSANISAAIAGDSHLAAEPNSEVIESTVANEEAGDRLDAIIEQFLHEQNQLTEQAIKSKRKIHSAQRAAAECPRGSYRELSKRTMEMLQTGRVIDDGYCLRLLPKRLSRAPATQNFTPPQDHAEPSREQGPWQTA
jgi:hypothetical protein